VPGCPPTAEAPLLTRADLIAGEIHEPEGALVAEVFSVLRLVQAPA